MMMVGYYGPYCIQQKFNNNLTVYITKMYTQPNNDHHRSFSFSGWQSRDQPARTHSKYYYNYSRNNNVNANTNVNRNNNGSMSIKNKYEEVRNQYRGDMPTFGDDGIRSRRRVTQESGGYQCKGRPDREPYGNSNYTADNWYQRRASQQQKSRQATLQAQPYKNLPVAQTRNQARQELDRATEQKLSNIDKINQKIKKILNTLNQEQKKITNHHIKIGNKKIGGGNYYANRIKTEGDDCQWERYQPQGRKDDSGDKENIYKKFVGLRERLQGQTNEYKQPAVEPMKNLYGRENYLTAQKRKQSNQNYGSNWKKTQTQSTGKKYQLLKGTNVNVKSTDSLNLSMSICLKNQKDSQPLQPYRERSKQRTDKYSSLVPSQEGYQKTSLAMTSTSKLFSKYTTFHQISEEDSSSYNTESRDRANTNMNSKVTTQGQEEYRGDFGMEDFRRIDKSNHRWMTTMEKEKEKEREKEWDRDDELPTFTMSKEKKEERTPMKGRFERSMSRYEKSEKSCKLSNGKDLDEEIEKIQKKIDSFENIKKSLNLQQSQSTKKSRIDLNKSLSKYKEGRYSAQKNKNTQPSEQMLRAISRVNTTVAQFNDSFLGSVKEDKSRKLQYEETNTNSSYQDNYSSEMEICLPKPFKMCSKKTTKRTINNSGVKQIQSAFMSEQRLDCKQDSLKTLINHLCKQIELDTSFRNSKKWFDRKPNPSKWNELGRQLSSRKIGTTEAQNRQIFTMADQQDNPFYTERDDQGSYCQLITNFLASQKYWIEHLQHKFVREELAPSIQEMDIDKKGTITIEDMVRYINLESDKYYRNRDLALVFRRLSGAKGEVTVEYILAQFSRTA